MRMFIWYEHVYMYVYMFMWHMCVCVWHNVYIRVHFYICAYKYISDADIMLKPSSDVKYTISLKDFFSLWVGGENTSERACVCVCVCMYCTILRELNDLFPILKV